MFVVKGAIFAVDGHGHVVWQVHMLQFRYRATILHVRSIATCAKNASDLDCLISICRGDQGTSGIVYDSDELDGQVSG